MNVLDILKNPLWPISLVSGCSVKLCVPCAAAECLQMDSGVCSLVCCDLGDQRLKIHTHPFKSVSPSENVLATLPFLPQPEHLRRP